MPTTLTLQAEDDLDADGPGAANTGSAITGGSSLLTSLVAAWKLDDLTDSTGRGNTLTNNNSATFNTGKIGNAVYVAAASSQYLSITSNTDVQLSSSDFTIGLWAYHSSFSGAKNIALGKDASGQREYYLFSEDTGTNNNRFKIAVFSGGAEKTAIANSFGDLSTATWYCVIAWWDSVAQTLNLSVNDGTTNTNNIAAALDAPASAALNIGRRSFAGFENYFDGRIDAVHVWKRVLSAADRTEFYNSGTGKEYPFS